MFISKNKPVPVVKTNAFVNETEREYQDAMRQVNRVMALPDPAQPVAATVGTYSCSMPYQMFRKLFNQEQLPNGFTIAYEYGHESFLVTYDSAADIPRHPEDDVPDSTK